MNLEMLDIKGKVKSRLNFKPIEFATGEITEIGNGAHVLIKKKKAEKVGLGKTIGILFFELDGEKDG